MAVGTVTSNGWPSLKSREQQVPKGRAHEAEQYPEGRGLRRNAGKSRGSIRISTGIDPGDSIRTTWRLRRSGSRSSKGAGALPFPLTLTVAPAVMTLPGPLRGLPAQRREPTDRSAPIIIPRTRGPTATTLAPRSSSRKAAGGFLVPK